MKKISLLILIISFLVVNKIQAIDISGTVVVSSICNGVEQELARFQAGQTPCVPIEICRECLLKVQYLDPMFAPIGLNFQDIASLSWGTPVNVFYYGEKNKFDLIRLPRTVTTISQISYVHFNEYYYLRGLCITIKDDCKPKLSCQECCDDFNSKFSLTKIAEIKDCMINFISRGVPCPEYLRDLAFKCDVNMETISKSYIDGSFIYRTYSIGSLNPNIPYDINFTLPHDYRTTKVCYKIKDCPSCELCIDLE